MLLAALVVPPAATATPVPHLPELAADNTFTTSESGFLEVRLSDQARWKWDIFEDRTLRIKGDGRVAGFLLVRQGTARPQGIYAAAFRVCNKPACSDGWSSWLTSFVFPIGLDWPKKGTTFTLPAGDYRAYVIADGADVEARLRLEDVNGSTHLSPTTPVRSAIGIESAQEPLKNLVTAGSTYELRGRGVSFIGFVERHNTGGVDFYNDCLYEGTPSLPPEIAFTPACRAAGANMGLGFGLSPGSGGGSGSYSIRPNMKPGVYSFGGSYVGAQSVQDAAFLSLWVEYE